VRFVATLVQPIKLGFRAMTEVWDEALAIGVGIIAVDFIGNMLRATVERFVPAAWVDPATEGVVGTIILIAGEFFAPAGWRIYTRLASIAALGLAVADAIAIVVGPLIGIGRSPIRGIKESPLGSPETPVSFA